MEKELKTGIIGCGKVAGAHAYAYGTLDISDFCAVCDVDGERAAAFAEKYGVRAYTDITEMVQKEKLDVVSVCTPHPFHARAAAMAAKSGCHVLVEKPFAVKVSDCDAMIGEAERNGVKIGTLFQRRFYEPCMRIREAIDQGKIGKPVMGNVTMLGWRDQAYYRSDPWRGTWEGEGGGVLPTQACHQLDLLLWFMGDEIDEVYGVCKNYNHPYIEVEDTAVAVIKFKNGALGTVSASNSQNPALFGKVRIHGDNGATVSVQTDGGAMFIAGMTAITEAPFNDIWTVEGESGMLDKWKAEDEKIFFSHEPSEYYHRLQIREFMTAVSEGREPLVNGYTGRKSVELLEAIYRSSETGLPVKFPIKR